MRERDFRNGCRSILRNAECGSDDFEAELQGLRAYRCVHIVDFHDSTKKFLLALKPNARWEVIPYRTELVLNVLRDWQDHLETDSPSDQIDESRLRTIQHISSGMDATNRCSVVGRLLFELAAENNFPGDADGFAERYQDILYFGENPSAYRSLRWFEAYRDFYFFGEHGKRTHELCDRTFGIVRNMLCSQAAGNVGSVSTAVEASALDSGQNDNNSIFYICKTDISALLDGRIGFKRLKEIWKEFPERDVKGKRNKLFWDYLKFRKAIEESDLVDRLIYLSTFPESADDARTLLASKRGESQIPSVQSRQGGP